MTGSDRDDIERVWRTRDEARASYDRLSRWYDRFQGKWEKTPRDLGARQLELAPGERVLELGCGTGDGLLALAAAVGKEGQVWGLDLSPRMVGLARDKIAGAGLGEQVEAVEGDAVSLPFPDACCDAVFMSFTLELFDTPEIPKVLAECRRVLRPGGRIAVVAMTKAGPAKLRTRIYEWGHRMLPRFFDCRPIYVEKALVTAGFHPRYVSLVPGEKPWAEVVVAEKPDPPSPPAPDPDA